MPNLQLVQSRKIRSVFGLWAVATAGLCGVVCTAPIALAALGIGTGAAIVCNASEAAALATVCAIGTSLGMVLLRRHRRRELAGCGCSAPQTFGTESSVPIACDLTVFTAAERARHMKDTWTVFSAIRHLTENTDGFTLSFAADSKLREHVTRWSKNEGRCCPFLSFHQTDLPDAFTVTISGPRGAKEILRGALEEHGLMPAPTR